MTPRMLMIACRQALALGPDAPLDDDEAIAPDTNRGGHATGESGRDDSALEAAWEEHLQRARAALDEAAEDRRSADPGRLVGGMACALRFARGVTTSRVDARHHLQLLASIDERSHAVALLHQTHPRSAITALERAAEALAKNAVLVVRQRSIEMPPTWKKVHATLSAVLHKGARWLTLERDDAARLLSLESFLAAAKSRDLEDAGGRAFQDGDVADWIARSLRVIEWPFVVAFTEAAARDTSAEGASAEAELAEPEPHGKAASAKKNPAGSASAADTSATIRTCLGQLHIASLERLVREVARIKPDATRTEVVAALDAMPEHVRWFGRAIVAVKEVR